jgi:rubrerythrin
VLDNEILAAIKAGMKGELDSVTVYEDAAGHAEGEVKEFFLERAAAEKEHFNYLLGYYRNKTVNLTPERNAQAELGGGWKSAIVGEAFLRQVAGSRHLMAAVTAALHLEFDAVNLYRGWLARAESPELARLLGMLVEWEERHYADLLTMQEELGRHYFDINNFEPF